MPCEACNPLKTCDLQLLSLFCHCWHCRGTRRPETPPSACRSWQRCGCPKRHNRPSVVWRRLGPPPRPGCRRAGVAPRFSRGPWGGGMPSPAPPGPLWRVRAGAPRRQRRLARLTAVVTARPWLRCLEATGEQQTGPTTAAGARPASGPRGTRESGSVAGQASGVLAGHPGPVGLEGWKPPQRRRKPKPRSPSPACPPSPRRAGGGPWAARRAWRGQGGVAAARPPMGRGEAGAARGLEGARATAAGHALVPRGAEGLHGRPRPPR
jgi:hypothetical protein